MSLHAQEAGLPHVATAGERAASIILLPITVFGLLANSFVAYLFWRYETLRRHPSNLLILGLCVGDGILMCLPRVIEAPIALVYDGYPAWYHPFCQLFGAMPLTSAYISVFTLGVVSMERYLAIVRGVVWTRREACLVAAGIWAAAAVIGVLLPVVTAFGKGTPHSPYLLQASGLYCLINWGDSSIAGRIQVVIAMVGLLLVIGTLVGGYFMIWLHVRTIASTVSATPRNITLTPSTATTSSVAETPQARGMGATMTKMERDLMWKAIVMSAIFLTNWLPYSIMIAYEGFTLTHDINKTFETVSYFGVEINAATNPLLFILLDTRVLLCARQALGLARPDEDLSSQPSSAVGSHRKESIIAEPSGVRQGKCLQEAGPSGLRGGRTREGGTLGRGVEVGVRGLRVRSMSAEEMDEDDGLGEA
ncbi:uncharacterized protein EV422DRAFT_571617 [Fimicolochytrium jonesii]|uniref:uncharacterized protein n=1 Tax=Fimicolochytrium jonesii TaxID=1396493 RepID=UPI0022FE7C85|nr:uncharacterized protein EV422DRAFT_571617 [Fimicolochytrium jonesii]KAI8816649.1 hypothetical protein EV422DRAFT_571617 [Fimicolochytrium jonesii]